MAKGANIAIGLIIGLVAGGLGGFGVSYLLNPPSPAPPTYHTLTIINYHPNTIEYLTWTPANTGYNYTNSGQSIVTIMFAENTNVSLLASPSGYFGAWLGLDAADVQVVSPYNAWIIMDTDKVIQATFT